MIIIGSSQRCFRGWSLGNHAPIDASLHVIGLDYHSNVLGWIRCGKNPAPDHAVPAWIGGLLPSWLSLPAGSLLELGIASCYPGTHHYLLPVLYHLIYHAASVAKIALFCHNTLLTDHPNGSLWAPPSFLSPTHLHISTSSGIDTCLFMSLGSYSLIR